MSDVSLEEQDLFADLVGQPLAVTLLKAALNQGRLAPAYLFAGPEGVGTSPGCSALPRRCDQ